MAIGAFNFTDILRNLFDLQSRGPASTGGIVPPNAPPNVFKSLAAPAPPKTPFGSFTATKPTGASVDAGVNIGAEAGADVPRPTQTELAQPVKAQPREKLATKLIRATLGTLVMGAMGPTAVKFGGGVVDVINRDRQQREQTRLALQERLRKQQMEDEDMRLKREDLANRVRDTQQRYEVGREGHSVERQKKIADVISDVAGFFGNRLWPKERASDALIPYRQEVYETQADRNRALAEKTRRPKASKPDTTIEKKELDAALKARAAAEKNMMEIRKLPDSPERSTALVTAAVDLRNAKAAVTKAKEDLKKASGGGQPATKGAAILNALFQD